MHWCFAIVNNRLAEVFFDVNRHSNILKNVGMSEAKIFGHCYVRREEYKTKRERRQVDQDIKDNKFVYRLGKYRRV